jgi:2,3-bisphosphoglycerate-dependent phosphoglycerate mutase
VSNLVLIRHGQSQWNKENRFTGWVNVDLSEQGIAEAKAAGKLLKKHDLTFDILYTSRLLRANRTAELIQKEMDTDLPMTKSWRLNERHYGALQGKNKKEIAEIHGDDQVKIWRRSYDTPPPALEEAEKLEECEETIPDVRCESLKDTYLRVLPYWEEYISKSLRDGKKVLIAAHGNSLRALMKYLYSISDEEIVKLEIPTGKPIVCHLDGNLMGTEYSYLE